MQQRVLISVVVKGKTHSTGRTLPRMPMPLPPQLFAMLWLRLGKFDQPTSNCARFMGSRRLIGASHGIPWPSHPQQLQILNRVGMFVRRATGAFRHGLVWELIGVSAQNRRDPLLMTGRVGHSVLCCANMD